MHARKTLRVRVRSSNPLVWVSTVRHALRRSGAQDDEIARFSSDAFEHEEADEMRAVCLEWAEIELDEGSP